MEILKQSPETLNKIIKILKSGGVVICPTDTVYGFLADAANKKAVDKIYKIKRRPKLKPLPVFVKNLTTAKEIAFIDKNQEKILKKHWPGKYTFILKRKTQKSKIYGVSEETIGLRLPKDKFLNDLLKRVHQPLVQTSVNISGEESLKKIKDIIEQFKKDSRINLIIDGGDLLESRPSKIVDLSRGNIKTLRT